MRDVYMEKKEINLILEKYADLIVRVGLNLQPGQKLFIVARQLEVAPLVQ
jgi:leucyl aminopeptidase (aminopeptidase T)